PGFAKGSFGPLECRGIRHRHDISAGKREAEAGCLCQMVKQEFRGPLRLQIFDPGVRRWMAAAAIASLIVGVLLTHLIEPGVGFEKVILAGYTPTIHLFPKTAGPHPVALLAHGVTASKETLFRFGEALAAAGFDCYAVDLPGHGESQRRFSGADIVIQMGHIARALGRVDVFVGHSMGAGAGQASFRNGDLSPKLFIALGANPSLGEQGPPLLLLAGNFEELISPARLKARSDARLVLSPWSDHALE